MDRTVHIGSLPTSVTRPDLDAICRQAGVVGELSAVGGGRATIVCPDSAAAKHAVERLHGTEVAGKRIKARLGSDEPSVASPGGVAQTAAAMVAAGVDIDDIDDDDDPLTAVGHPIHDPWGLRQLGSRGALPSAAPQRQQLQQQQQQQAKAGARSSASAKPKGDWTCSSCGRLNYSWSKRCGGCPEKRPDLRGVSAAREGTAAMGGGGGGGRGGGGGGGGDEYDEFGRKKRTYRQGKRPQAGSIIGGGILGGAGFR